MYMGLGRKPEGKRPLGKPSRRRYDSIQIDLKGSPVSYCSFIRGLL
jgi:hypothetical protein